jgi:hypothetical protein
MEFWQEQMVESIETKTEHQEISFIGMELLPEAEEWTLEYIKQ